MRYIDRITDTARQRLRLTGNEDQIVTMVLRYMPSQQAWYADFIYEEFSVYGVQVVASPNLLRGYKNKIPFGITVTTETGIDPYKIDDFLSGRAKMFLMNETDVSQFEEALFE